MRDKELMVTIPAHLLHHLTALADGYTMDRGRWIGDAPVQIARNILWDSGYDSWQDEPIPESRDWNI